MLEINSNQSGHTVTINLKGSNYEVCNKIASLINQYCNAGYDGKLVSFNRGDIAKFDGMNWYAVFEHDSNCD